MTVKHLNIHVYGRVQGVGFRFSARKYAIGLGLKGFIRNELDGSVYIEVEGDEERLNPFLKWCYEGPSLSKPDYVEVQESKIRNFQTFDIRH